MLFFKYNHIILFFLAGAILCKSQSNILSTDNSPAIIDLNSQDNNYFDLPYIKDFDNKKIKNINDPKSSFPSNDMTKSKENFFNNNQLITKKLNEKINPKNEEGNFNRYEYLGDFSLNSKNVRLVFRDFGQVDGDRIKVLLNDKIIIGNIVLLNGFKMISLKLHNGFNKIEFVALNQGMIGPNTAEIHAYDDAGNKIMGNQWGLATGGKAVLLLINE